MDGSRDLAQAPASAGCKAGGLTKHYAFIDYATQGYMVLVGLLVLAFHNDRVSAWPLLLACHAVVIGLVHWLIQAQAARPANKVLEFVRHFYPVLLYTAFYRETGSLNQMFVAGYLDAFFIRLEEQVFHVQPSLAFMEALPFLPVSELFYVSYFSYYVMIAGVGLALFFRNRAQFYHYVSVVSFVFYVCYLLYIFLPVMGPRIFFKELTDYNLPDEFLPSEFLPGFPAAVQLGPFYRIMALIYHVFEAPGAAFTSSHVAVAITTAFFSYRYLRSIRRLHFVVVVLLCIATVYCRYHYVVDVVAGALTAGLLIPLGNALYFKLSRARE